MDKELHGAINIKQAFEKVKNFTFTYYVLKSEVAIENQHATTYGIRIDKSDCETSQVLESEAIADICFEKAEIDEFARRLSEDCTAPSGLADAASEFVEALYSHTF